MSVLSQLQTSHVFGTTAVATTVIVPAVVNQHVAVHRVVLTLGATAVLVTLRDTAGNPISQAFQLTANDAMVLDMHWPGEPWFVTANNLGLQLFQSGTTTINYDFWYLQVP